MALLNKIRRDTKKSSYYVWFLGAQESKGLRGVEYITPVLKNLIEREKTIEPFKITLQVSHKGLKIIQNLSNLNQKPFSTKGDGKPEQKPNKNDVIKHFIPHHAVTCVLQEDDVVACILLLYNPVTRCPVHVHAYRCDSKETASLLTNQLTTLILRPDNQKKMNEIEGRLRAKGLLLPTVPRVNIPKRLNSSGSEGRSTTTSPASESSGGSAGSTGGCQNERITNLYDSLAAELREKLGMGTDSKSSHAPILLPPRDYDTVHRQKGNLTGIEMRRCLNENIVGIKTKKEPLKESTDKKNIKGGPLGRILESSGGSSGIGSDHPPSPDQNGRYLDNHSTSDDEWVEHPSEDSLFLMSQEGRNNSGSWRNNPEQMSLPRAKRYGHNRLDSQTEMHRGDPESPNRTEQGYYKNDENGLKKRNSSPREQKKDGSNASRRSDSPRTEENLMRKRNASPYKKPNGQKSPVNLRSGNRHSESESYTRSYSPRYDAKDGIDEPPVKVSATKNFHEAIPREKSSISLENFRKKNDKGNMSPVGVVAPRRRTSEESRGKTNDAFWDEDDSYKRRIPGYKDKKKSLDENFPAHKEFSEKVKRIEEHKMSPKERKMRENTMKLSPQERFLDAKSKFLMLEKERLKEQDKNAQNMEKKRSLQDEAPISPEIIKNRPSWNRSEESKKLQSQKAELVRRNSFFEIDNTDKYYEKETRGKSINHIKNSVHDQELQMRRLSRSDSRSRFFSHERLSGDMDFEIRYRSESPKKYKDDPDDPRKMRMRDENEYQEHRRPSRCDYTRDWERDHERYASPSRDVRKYSTSNNRRQTISDDENYPDDTDRYRYEKKRYDNERSFSNERVTPPRKRCDNEEDDFRRRRCLSDEEDVPINFKSQNKIRAIGRDEKAVPYEKNNKSKYEMMEKEKRLSSNALAKEFKRRSYQDKFDKIESEKRMSYIERDYEGKYCDEYPDEIIYPEKSDVRRRNQYNLANAEIKRNSHELAKEFNRRSRAYSHESDEDCRKPRGGYPEHKERERYPGVDRESSRVPHHQVDDCHPETGKLSRINSDDHDRFIEPPRLVQIQVDRMPARYRHSFVENPPGLSVMAPGRGHEMLHRTNSSVSSNRVGIAAIHPY